MNKFNPTEEEMTSVLMEFYQRNLREAPKESGVPKPFLIQTDTQNLGPSSVMGRRRSEDTRSPYAQNAFVRPETDYVLNQYSYYHASGAKWFMITFALNRNNMGTISDALYVSVLWGYWVCPGSPPPTDQGPLIIGFNGSTWDPPAPDEPPAFPVMQCSLGGTVPATGTIGIRLGITLQHSSGDRPYVDNIHTAGSPFWSEDNVSYPCRIKGEWSM